MTRSTALVCVQSLKNASCVLEIVKVIIIPAHGKHSSTREGSKGKVDAPTLPAAPSCQRPSQRKTLAGTCTSCKELSAHETGPAVSWLCSDLSLPTLPHPPPRAWGGLHLPRVPRAALKTLPRLVFHPPSPDRPRVAWALVDHLVFSCRMLLSLWKAEFVFHL